MSPIRSYSKSQLKTVSQPRKSTWPWTHVLVGPLTVVARNKGSLNLFEFRWTLQMLPWKLFQIQTGRVQRYCWGGLLCARRWQQKWVSPKFLQSLVPWNTTYLTYLYDKRKKEVLPCCIHWQFLNAQGTLPSCIPYCQRGLGCQTVSMKIRSPSPRKYSSSCHNVNFRV